MKNGRNRCRAKSKATGKQCRRAPIAGAAVCRVHGGAAPQVRAKAEERIKEYVRQMVDPDRVLAEAARLAFSDATALYDENGQLKPMKDWPPEARAAVANFETVRRNVDSGDGHTDDVIKVRVWDKVKALEMLAKHLGLLVERTAANDKLEISWKS